MRGLQVRWKMKQLTLFNFGFPDVSFETNYFCEFVKEDKQEELTKWMEK